jgi:hypothetical protein
MKLISFKLFFLLAFTSCLIFLQSCIVHKLKVNRSEGEFYGIRSVIAENDKLSIFVTHGMGFSNMDFANQMINSITNTLEFKPIDTVFHRQNKSVVKVLTYSKGEKELKFYIHGWYPATGIKAWLLFADTNRDRLETMSDIKNNLMNQSIADVIMYQGNFRDIIKKDMELTLKLMVSERPNAKFIGISESLGSKIFIDTMNDNLKDKTDWAIRWQANLTSIFMLSNQLPLLFLGDLDTKEEWVVAFKSDTSRSNEAQIQQTLRKAHEPLMEFTSYGDRSNSKVQLVAISDPNDILSYPVPASAVFSENFELTNVTVSIAEKGYSWPFGKPKIVNPIDAHLNYQKNQHVINYLIDGYALQTD